MVLFGLPVIMTHIILAMTNSPLMLYLVCFLQDLCHIVGWITGSEYGPAYTSTELVYSPHPK